MGDSAAQKMGIEGLGRPWQDGRAAAAGGLQVQGATVARPFSGVWARCQGYT